MSGLSGERNAGSEEWQPLVIHAAGLCCAVGYSLAAASCAIRAGVDHFQESPFIDHTGGTLLCARLDLDDVWGPERLAQLVKMAVIDCESAGQKIDPASTVLILLAAERGRPHTDTDNYNDLYRVCEEQFQTAFHEGSAVFPQGRAAIGDALWHAQKQLKNGKVERVLLVGADSLLDAATIEHYLEQERLLCNDNASGFIAGEGAATLLLGMARDSDSGLRITGVGRALELAKPDGELPNRAVGLTAAIRQACTQARCAPNQLDFRVTDQNGETFFAKETANAYARVMSSDGTNLPMQQIADCVGETGAAAAAMSLAYLTVVMFRADAPGKRALLHFASDDGKRAALIVEHPSAT